jgi:osmotically inducible protein OsmC
MKRSATAQWKGAGIDGTGSLTTQSGAFQDQPYSFKTRFQNEDGKLGTNPEELIAAAHAGCFNMALSFQLAGAGFPATSLDTEAIVAMRSEDVHWHFDTITLNLVGDVPGIDEAKFLELATAAKDHCPISEALSAVKIILNASLK